MNYAILLGLFVFFSTELELGFVCFVATVESLLPATPLRDWDSLLGRKEEEKKKKKKKLLGGSVDWEVDAEFC